MYAFLIGGMVILLSGGIVLALSFSLATDNQIEYGLNNGTALSSSKGTELLWHLHIKQIIWAWTFIHSSWNNQKGNLC